MTMMTVRVAVVVAVVAVEGPQQEKAGTRMTVLSPLATDSIQVTALSTLATDSILVTDNILVTDSILVTDNTLPTVIEVEVTTEARLLVNAADVEVAADAAPTIGPEMIEWTGQASIEANATTGPIAPDAVGINRRAVFAMLLQVLTCSKAQWRGFSNCTRRATDSCGPRRRITLLRSRTRSFRVRLSRNTVFVKAY